MSLDLTSYDAALKQHYTANRVENMVYRENPLMAMINKYEKFGGRNLPIPIIYGNPQGRSKTFSQAQAQGASTNSLITDFILTRAKDYSIATIDNETLEASKGDANAFMEAATTEIDGAINSLTRSVAIGDFRDSSAEIGQVSAEPGVSAGTFTVTIKENSDITNYEVGQVLNIWSAKSGGVQRSSDGSLLDFPVAGVNRTTGVLTITGSYDGSGTIAADDYLFVKGDRGLGFSGLEAWIPAVAPTSTPFFGVDRSVDPTRLGGQRLDATSTPIEEALIEGDAIVGREGWALSHYFMSHTKLGDLKKALGSKVQYVDMKVGATGKISFRGVLIDGQKGPIRCVADQNCPENRIYGLTLNTWKKYSLGKCVRVIDTDGLQMLRQASADGVEVRYGTYSNLATCAPGANINVQV